MVLRFQEICGVPGICAIALETRVKCWGTGDESPTFHGAALGTGAVGPVTAGRLERGALETRIAAEVSMPVSPWTSSPRA